MIGVTSPLVLGGRDVRVSAICSTYGNQDFK